MEEIVEKVNDNVVEEKEAEKETKPRMNRAARRRAAKEKLAESSVSPGFRQKTKAERSKQGFETLLESVSELLEFKTAAQEAIGGIDGKLAAIEQHVVRLMGEHAVLGRFLTGKGIITEEDGKRLEELSVQVAHDMGLTFADNTSGTIEEAELSPEQKPQEEEEIGPSVFGGTEL